MGHARHEVMTKQLHEMRHSHGLGDLELGLRAPQPVACFILYEFLVTTPYWRWALRFSAVYSNFLSAGCANRGEHCSAELKVWVQLPFIMISKDSPLESAICRSFGQTIIIGLHFMPDDGCYVRCCCLLLTPIIVT